LSGPRIQGLWDDPLTVRGVDPQLDGNSDLLLYVGFPGWYVFGGLNVLGVLDGEMSLWMLAGVVVSSTKSGVKILKSI
jgi:hypothetical protein